MVYNILASFSDITNPPVQYSLMKKKDYRPTDFDVVPMQQTARLAFIACSCLLENLH